MKKIVQELVNSKIEHMGIYVNDAFISEVENKKVFNIELGSSDVIDLDKVTEASQIINQVIDSTDQIEHNYDELDIYSEEKGD